MDDNRYRGVPPETCRTWKHRRTERDDEGDGGAVVA